ncbi:hypothetical protein [Streptomyces sp. Ag82_O1-15]|nr:hypothetical protein [Streptomyces sp. Ag82_O1-15]
MEIVPSEDERVELVRRAELPDRHTAERARLFLASDAAPYTATPAARA